MMNRMYVFHSLIHEDLHMKEKHNSGSRPALTKGGICFVLFLVLLLLCILTWGTFVSGLSAILAVIIAFALFWDIPTIIGIWNFFMQYPLLWIAVIIYAVVCVCFVVGIPFKKYNR